MPNQYSDKYSDKVKEALRPIIQKAIWKNNHTNERLDFLTQQAVSELLNDMFPELLGVECQSK